MTIFQRKPIYLNSLMWLLVFLPLLQLMLGIYQVQIMGDLLYWGAEPGKAVVHIVGEWALFYLVVVLAVRHIKKLGLNLLPYRRRLGLSVFFYALLHMLAYLLLMLGLQWGDLAEDIQKRPYILVGALAIVLLMPLAITSTKAWQKRLKRKWKTLHRLVYPVAILVMVHLWWQVKAEFSLALFISVLFVSFIGLKIYPILLAYKKTSSNL
jgi:sulfoxide reductase heme-binding subunit YedZ